MSGSGPLGLSHQEQMEEQDNQLKGLESTVLQMGELGRAISMELDEQSR